MRWHHCRRAAHSSGRKGQARSPRARDVPLQELYRQYRHVKFRCGEDDDGYSVKMKLKYFLRYMAQQKDDSPLYIFDNHFDGNQKAQTILKQYEVPKYFRDDLFRLVGEKRRPPYRWCVLPRAWGTIFGPWHLMGAVPITGCWSVPSVRGLRHTRTHSRPVPGTRCCVAESGACARALAWRCRPSHRCRPSQRPIPPAARWVLFHPDTPRKWVKEKYYKLPREDDEPIDYFENILPRIRAAHPDLKIWDFVQYPGEWSEWRHRLHTRATAFGNWLTGTRRACRRNHLCAVGVVARCAEPGRHHCGDAELLQSHQLREVLACHALRFVPTVQPRRVQGRH